MPGWKRAFQGGVHGGSKQPGCEREKYKPFHKVGPWRVGEGISDRDEKVAWARLQKARLCCTKEIGLYSQAKVKAYADCKEFWNCHLFTCVGDRLEGRGSRQIDYHKGTSSWDSTKRTGAERRGAAQEESVRGGGSGSLPGLGLGEGWWIWREGGNGDREEEDQFIPLSELVLSGGCQGEQSSEQEDTWV